MRYLYKRILFISMGTFILYGCNDAHKGQADSPQKTIKKKYSVTGIIHGADSEWVYLRHADHFVQGSKLDSTKMIHGKFKFNGELEEGPEPFLLGIRYQTGGKRSFIINNGPFILDSGNLNMEFNKDSFGLSLWEAKAAWGTKGQDEYNEFKQKINPIYKATDKIYGEKYSAKKSNTKLFDSLEKALDQYNKQIKEIVKNQVKANPSSVISAYIVMSSLHNSDSETIKPLYDLFTPEVKNSTYGKRVLRELQAGNRTAIGMPAPDFNLPDKSDKTIYLKSYRGKYVLVDFWASWCYPCRQENPNLIKAYAGFKNKGFEIISISFDKDKKPWLGAVKQDGLPWTQLWAQKDTIGKTYGITSIPMNFLLDKNGNILASNLSGGELQKKLAEIIK